MKINLHRVLSLDIGTKRIGVAKWDPKVAVVQPGILIHVTRPIQAFDVLKDFAADFKPHTLVLGNPLMPNGKPGEIAHLVYKWSKKLASELPYEVVLWDERMTSKQAERDLQAIGMKSTKIRQTVDVAAAMRILENWIDAQVDDE